MYKLYRYNSNQYRIICCSDNSNVCFDNDNEADTAESLRCSLSRSKRMIREYILCNNFVWFFTLTINSKYFDRYNLSLLQKNVRKRMKAIKRRCSDFEYIFITEEHKDGAFHFHGVCTDFDSLYTNKYGYYSSADFDLLGFNSFSKINDKDKTSNYICKYITKKCVRNDKGSVYFCSRGLKRAESYEIKSLDFSRFDNEKYFHNWSNGLCFHKNDFCKVIDYDITSLERDDLLYLINNIVNTRA